MTTEKELLALCSFRPQLFLDVVNIETNSDRNWLRVDDFRDTNPEREINFFLDLLQMSYVGLLINLISNKKDKNSIRTCLALQGLEDDILSKSGD
jgi:hypothetical protein